jgi:hypothetical protein
MDFIIILEHAYSGFTFADSLNRDPSKISFLDDSWVQGEMCHREEKGLSWEELDELEKKRGEEDKARKENPEEYSWTDELGLEKDGKTVIPWDEEYACAFESLFEEFINSGNRILICRFSFPLARMIGLCVDHVEKNQPICHFYCVAFSHNDADTQRMHPDDSLDHCLGWRRWYTKSIECSFRFVHLVEIPYVFGLNDEYLWALVDKDSPLRPDSRKRRKWLGSAERRYERGLAKGTEVAVKFAEKEKAEGVQPKEKTNVN